MVQHLSSLDGVNINNTWLTIGSYDGVHIGHQKLTNEMTRQAHKAEAKSVVLTFHPHPAVILRGKTNAFYLTTPSEKIALLDKLDTDIVVVHPFTLKLSQSTAREFVVYLTDHLGFKQLWVGYDFALGKGREGNLPYLELLGAELGYKVHAIEPVLYGGSVVSSSQIRNLIREGNIILANKLLGRYYHLAGEVVHGDGRGKEIGIPTANLLVDAEKLIPGSGVYACRVQIADQFLPAAVNIGTRPTFESSDQRSHVEAHILDFSRDLYTQNIAIDFIARLRGEQRFQNVEALIKQVQADIEQTREIVSGIKDYIL